MDVTRHVLADPAMFLIKCNFDVERFNCWNTQADVPSSFSSSPSFFSINELRIWHSSLAFLREGNPLTRATERRLLRFDLRPIHVQIRSIQSAFHVPWPGICHRFPSSTRILFVNTGTKDSGHTHMLSRQEAH